MKLCIRYADERDYITIILLEAHGFGLFLRFKSNFSFYYAT